MGQASGAFGKDLYPRVSNQYTHTLNLLSCCKVLDMVFHPIVWIPYTRQGYHP